MSPLRRILAARAREPREGSQVYVKGGWVDRVTSVPTDGGIEAVVRFADACWRKNIALNREVADLRYLQELEFVLDDIEAEASSNATED